MFKKGLGEGRILPVISYIYTIYYHLMISFLTAYQSQL